MSTERDAVTGLSPEAAELIENYFARVHGALLVAATGESEEAVADLRMHVLEQLADTGGTPAEAARVLDALGTPEALAAAYSAQGDDESSSEDRLSEVDTIRLHGRLLGMPYDVRMPNSDRIASRMWNPLDPRIFVPRIFGLGWDVNFGALAVKAHLVQPDDEDEPFAAVPAPYVTATVVLPALMAAALLVMVAMNWAVLPAQIPSHWNIAGQADNFWPRGTGVAFLVFMGLAPLVYAVSVHMRRRPALNRVAASAFAALLSTIALSQFVQTLAYVSGDRGTTPTFVGIALGLVLPFVMLVALSRIGRAVEVRRDLDKTSKKGTV